MRPVWAHRFCVQEPDRVDRVVDVEVEGDTPHKNQAQRELYYLHNSIMRDFYECK